MNECLVKGCVKPLDQPNRKYCGAHRARLRRTGSLGSTEVKRVPPSGLNHIEIIQFNGWTVTERGCWEYNGPRFPKGYGQVKALGSNPKLAHRIVFEDAYGKIADGLLIRHDCDNPPCINPQHLQAGTHKDNAQDREKRNRGRWNKEE